MESRRDRTHFSSFPAACGSELGEELPRPVPYTCASSLTAVTGCTQPRPPGVMVHWLWPLRQNQVCLSSQRAHWPFPDPLFYGCICHKTEGVALSQREANTKLDNFCETFCRNKDVDWSDRTTRIHKGIK